MTGKHGGGDDLEMGMMSVAELEARGGAGQHVMMIPLLVRRGGTR